MKYNHDEDSFSDKDEPNRVVPCPECGQIERVSWIYWLERGIMDIMCWRECGTDFQVSGIYWMLNTYERE
jgi:hypothetical protein